MIPGTLIHGTISRGVVRVIFLHRSDEQIAGAVRRLAASGARITGERLPLAAWTALHATSNSGSDDSRVVLATLMRRVKDTYDPMHLLNPGILGEGIA
jgi:FAD/FMN-containing dehydrogenase